MSDAVVEKRRASLELATTVRVRRAQMKADLRTRLVMPQTLIASPPDWLATAPVESVLLATPGVGPQRVQEMVAYANRRLRAEFGDQARAVRSDSPCGELTLDERLALAIAVVQCIHRPKAIA